MLVTQWAPIKIDMQKNMTSFAVSIMIIKCFVYYVRQH